MMLTAIAMAAVMHTSYLVCLRSLSVAIPIVNSLSANFV